MSGPSNLGHDSSFVNLGSMPPALLMIGRCSWSYLGALQKEVLHGFLWVVACRALRAIDLLESVKVLVQWGVSHPQLKYCARCFSGYPLVQQCRSTHASAQIRGITEAVRGPHTIPHTRRVTCIFYPHPVFEPATCALNRAVGKSPAI
jgi:hypothetical protein